MRKVWLLGIWLTLCAPLFASDTRELVLFPFGTTSTVQQPEDFNLNAELMGALYAQLKDIPNLYVWRFRENSPSVRRALDENRLRRDRLGDPRPAVPGVAAPEPRGPVQHLPPVRGGVVHVLRPHEHPRRRLELAIGGEGHPERPEIVGGRRGAARHG